MIIKNLYIHKDALNYPETHSIQARLGMAGEIIDTPHILADRLATSEDPVGEGKKSLFLTTNKGAFLKKCPGTRNYICCGYQILHFGSFCSLDCAYCVLQAYFHPPILQYFVNHSGLFEELDSALLRKQVQRFGTGEFTDSLIWESISDLTPSLIDRFAKQHGAILELKTKTVHTVHLEHLNHNRKTVMAWSLNAAPVIKREEKHTSSIDARLKAAADCESWGYPLAFHFDPIIFYDGCIEDYRRTIDAMAAHVSPENIVWISLGAFRFMPDLKTIIQKRFPESVIIYQEFIPGLDNKMRYFKPIRIQLFREIVSLLKQWSPSLPIYLCMEDEEVWQKSLGFSPEDKGGLSHMLDQWAIGGCDLKPK